MGEVDEVDEGQTAWQRFVACASERPGGGLVRGMLRHTDANGYLTTATEYGSPLYRQYTDVKVAFRQWCERESAKAAHREFADRVAARQTPAVPELEPISDRDAIEALSQLVLELVEALDEAARFTAEGGLAFDRQGHPRSPVGMRARVRARSAELLQRLRVPVDPGLLARPCSSAGTGGEALTASRT